MWFRQIIITDHALMITNHMILTELKHETCMVDLLGHLQEVENVIKTMPWKPDVAAWITLLSACRIHDNVEMAEYVTKWVLKLECKNVACYVMLSSVYVIVFRGISMRMLNSIGKNEVWKNNQVATGLNWILRCIHL